MQPPQTLSWKRGNTTTTREKARRRARVKWKGTITREKPEGAGKADSFNGRSKGVTNGGENNYMLERAKEIC